MPNMLIKITFTVGLLLRPTVRRELAKYLDRRDGITYQIKEYKGWLDSDFLLVLCGPGPQVQQTANVLREWFLALDA